jgi:crotonobetainyl-CoA:carnitine CoA-transferase CaiB-like acyl-CoA transferase
VRNHVELNRFVEEWTLQYEPQEVMRRMQEAGVAAGVVQNIAQVANDPHLQARAFMVEIQHPEMGRTLHAGLPIKHSATPGQVRSHAPLIGEHNNYVFQQLLGMSREEIQHLEALGVLE